MGQTELVDDGGLNLDHIANRYGPNMIPDAKRAYRPHLVSHGFHLPTVKCNIGLVPVKTPDVTG